MDIIIEYSYESFHRLSTLPCFVLCDFGELYKLLSLGGLGRAVIGKDRHNNIRTADYVHKYKIDPLPADTGEAIPVIMSSSSDEDESWQ